VGPKPDLHSRSAPNLERTYPHPNSGGVRITAPEGWEAASSTEVRRPFDLGPGRPEKFQEACLFSGRSEYHCPVRNHVREVFDGSKLIAYRLALDPAGNIPWASSCWTGGLVMFRKVAIALLATAALGMLAPNVVSARGGGGGGFHSGGGGFHGGIGGGFGGGGFYRRDGFGRGGFHTTRFSGGRFRRAAIGGRAFRAGFRAGLIAGTSRSATHMTGLRTRPEVVRCIASDCSLWHSYSE
jgi:hypothetical protein